MIRCIAIDDEPLALKQLVSYIERTSFLQLVAACESAIIAMDFIRNEQIDLMFLDIEMPDLNGMEFYKSVENLPQVIFTTAYSQYAIDGYKVDAIDYLLKPIDYPDFLRAADKARALSEMKKQTVEKVRSDEHFLFIKSEYKIIRIEFKNIEYIEGMNEYVRIHLTGAKPIMSLMTLKSLENMLPDDSFMRVHRSFIVNLKKITVVERNRILFGDNKYIPVSDQYKEEFNNYIEKYFL
ncbi:MAG: LytTR family DNA-binding domain-containing protein [Bacteroidota bacterium]